MRNGSFGEKHNLTIIDKLGVYLSSYKIIAFVKKNKPAKIIDIGCGFNATTLNQLKKYSTDLIGVDSKINSALSAIKKIEKDIYNDLSFLESDSADLIILNSVLEHLSYPQEILNEIYRVLNKNGTLILNAPNWLGKYFLELSAFKFHLSPINEMNDHKMYYNKKDIWPLFIKGGFKPKNIKIKYHKLFLNTICYAKK